MYYFDVYEPRLSDYDCKGKLSWEALLQILEHTGTHHTISVSDKVVDNGIAWVLVDWRIEITRRPKQFQALHIKTWVHGKAPASTVYRSYIVTDDKERELLRACAKFALVDLKAQKMTRISEDLFLSYGPEDAAAFDDEALRLREPEAFDTVHAIALRRSDIDYNGHVHNTRYVDYALDALPETDYARDDYTRLRVVYRAAVKPGSHPEIKRAAINGGWLLGVAAEEKICALIALQA